MTRGKRKYSDPFDFECNHGRAGIVTTHPEGLAPGYDGPHAAVTVCGDPTCRALAFGWVRRQTGMDGVYVSDSSRRNK